MDRLSMISSDDLRQAMSKFATGVTVIGSLETNGTVHGMTANAITSVSLEPPMVLVCIARDNVSYTNIAQRGRFGISVLKAQQEGAAQYYGRDRWERAGDVAVEWQLKEGGSPRIKDSLMFLECRVVARHDHGDHGIFVAQVEEVATEQGQPLIFYDSQFRAMGSTK